MRRQDRPAGVPPPLPGLSNQPHRDLYLENLRRSYRIRSDKRRRDRRAGILLLIGIAIILAICCLAESAWSGTPAAVPTAGDVDRALKWWVRDAPRNPLRVASYRLEVAEALVDQTTPRGIPVELAAAMVLRESSGAQDARGARGEIGLMQVHPGTAALFRCRLGTPDEQVECGCRVLAHHMDRCPTLRGALSAYGSRGSKCRPKPGSRLEKMVDSRYRLAAELRAVMDGSEKTGGTS